MLSIDHEAEQHINAQEAEFGADGTRVFRDMEPEHEKTALPADGSEISLASLYSGEADVPAISFAWDETQRCYLATNLSERDWKYRLGNQDGLLGARRSMALLPGIRLSLLPRRLELMYDWPQ